MVHGKYLGAVLPRAAFLAKSALRGNGRAGFKWLIGKAEAQGNSVFSLCPSFKDFADIPTKQLRWWHGTLTPAEHSLQHCSHSRTHKEPGCRRRKKRQGRAHNESPGSPKLSTPVAKTLTEKRL